MSKVYQILAFVLGMTCFIVQIVLIREYLNLFMGNELVIGIMLALWMLLTAAGAISGRRIFRDGKSTVAIFNLIILSGILPLAGAFLSVWLRTVLYAPGVMLSLQGVLLISLAGLSAFCLGSGIMFTLLAASLSEYQKNNSISRIYAMEALGSLSGGIIFNFILIYSLNSMQILSLVMGLNMLAAIWFAARIKKVLAALIALTVAVLLITSAFLLDLDLRLAKMLYPEQKVVVNKDTPFGKLVVTEMPGQYNYYMTGNPVLISDNVMNREEKVHYAMCLHPSPGDILMLSGGLDGSLDEILKYDIRKLDYVEQDHWFMEAAVTYNVLKWPENTRLINADPGPYLRDCPDTYDVIILNTEPPSTIGINRFYTSGFFHDVKQKLNPGGIFSLGLPPAGNYLDEEGSLLYATILNTLKQSFDHIRIIPGNSSFFIASDGALEGDIAQLIKAKNIPTSYVNEYYLSDRQINDRARMIMEKLDPGVRPNTSARPLAAYLGTLRWLSMFHIPVWLIVLIPLFLMIMIMLKLSIYNLGLFTTGFTASAAEFLLLIAFQSIYGFIYQMAGLIIMIFMAGLVAGVGFMYRIFSESRRTFIRLQIGLGISMFLLPPLISLEVLADITWLPGLLIGVITFLLAVVTGIQYRLATRLRPGTPAGIASSSYGADLAGSAFGMFFVAVIIFPLIGIHYTALILVLMNILMAFVLYLKKESIHG